MEDDQNANSDLPALQQQRTGYIRHKAEPNVHVNFSVSDPPLGWMKGRIVEYVVERSAQELVCPQAR